MRNPSTGQAVQIPKPKKMAKKKSSVSKSSATKANGTLKKGYRYAKGGRIVKAKS